MSLFTLVTLLFLILDPIGNIPSSLTLTKNLSDKRRIFILLREMTIALTLMILFFFIGDYILDILGISICTTRLASGIILFLIAIKILFPTTDSLRANLPSGEPFITPLAVPLLAGPGLLATIMLFSHLEERPWILLVAIFIAWILALAVILSGKYLKKVVGTNSLFAAERLMGIILVMLAIQRTLDGLQQFIQNCHVV